MQYRLDLLLAGLLALVPAAAHGLEWTTTQVEATAGPLDEQFSTSFGFSNPGSTPVTITEIRSSCGCTVPELAKRVYAPGESGEVKVSFEFGGRVGKQVKTVIVATDEPGNPQQVLTLEITIPQLFEVPRAFVLWRRGEAAEPKSIEVRVLRPEEIKLVGVESRDQRFAATLEPGDEKGLYRVVVPPGTTEAAMQTTLIVKSDFPAGNPRVVTLYALVR